MATIGRRAAVADFHGLKLKGTIGWLAWLVVHIYYLIGFRTEPWCWPPGVELSPLRPSIRLILRSEADSCPAAIDTDSTDSV
jgi:hypothetical protein